MILEDTLRETIERRSVRAVARVGSYDGPHPWAGSIPQLLVVDRKVSEATRELRGGVVFHLFPYDVLELGGFPTGLLAEARIEYDPTRLLHRQQNSMATMDAGLLKEQAQKILKDLPLNRQADLIHALLVSREVFLSHVVPLHMPPEQMFLSECRYPEYLQNRLSLSSPRILGALDELFALRHPEEAPALLAATRGLSLTQQEKRARIAVEAGFRQGSIFYLRQESVKVHREALKQWTHLPATRRERLSQLWGLEHAPLGWVAVNLVRELL
ncbi:hypothetical protein [Deinococcus cellulosilyticus]|uniref:Uncharacterized protein n=1 Tax=Deinococcus cellulosilyticus (strain DSM 18568 / NBRC 106333 / KACC 11606 / 5516J-15) TaxID=1223518 RepID=A0A511MXV2_DEIC1|nr:hypothetical protein [Deinococcus cellulosilyticus]GEM45400.1 hypothetical protein DC3_10350 [Deinococcus cellulosilyticus NBRC 106333 = KACC 11606]